MKRRKAVLRYEGKSLKTFFLYTISVVLVIAIALAIKLFLVIRVSKFDGQHQFVIVVAEQGRVQEILSYDPSAGTTSALQIEGNKVSLNDVGRTLAVLPNATVNFSQDIPLQNDATEPLWQIMMHYNLVKKDFTFYDLGRLYLFSKSVSQVNRQEKTLSLPSDPQSIDKVINTLFADSVLSQENLTVEVINATDISGLGQRLESILENQGVNIVAVTTAQSTSAHSLIQYYGNASYTVTKMSTLLHFPISHLDKQAIADIIITIGEDQKNRKAF